VVEYLCANKAMVNIRENLGATPLMMAQMRGYNEVLAILQKYGAK